MTSKVPCPRHQLMVALSKIAKYHNPLKKPRLNKIDDHGNQKQATMIMQVERETSLNKFAPE